MNEHYARTVHEGRMSELRAEASGFQRVPRRSRPALAPRVADFLADLRGKTRALGVRLRIRRAGVPAIPVALAERKPIPAAESPISR